MWIWGGFFFLGEAAVSQRCATAAHAGHSCARGPQLRTRATAVHDQWPATASVRGGIDTMEPHIRQYDKCLEVVLVLPNIWITTIFVTGNMYRYIGKVSFRDQKASWS